MYRRTLISVGALLALAGCVNLPAGPSLPAYPGTAKTFDQFSADDAACRQYALASAGGKTAQQAAQASAVESAAVGTAVGAAAGALIGGSEGAGVGAGTGLVVGSAVGASTAQQSAYGTQQRYDAAYFQCMYAKGEKVPVASGFVPPPGAVYASPYPQPYRYP
jgi:Glycine-zipper domain